MGEPAVVIRERLPEAEHLARRTAVVVARGRILRGPLQQHRVVRVHAAGRHEVRLRLHVARVGVGVELAVAARAGLRELRMEREALKAALAPLRLDADAPVGRVDVEYLTTVLPS